MISPTEQAKFASESAEFECHFDSCAGLLWEGPAITLGVPEHYTITTKDSYSAVLTINDLSEDDEGQYSCTCDGLTSTQADLIVHRESISNLVEESWLHYFL